MRRTIRTIRELGGRQFDLYALLMLLNSLLPVFIAIVARRVIDGLVARSSITVILLLLALEAALTVGEVALGHFNRYLSEGLRYRVVQGIQLHNARQAATLDISFFENPDMCSLLHRLRQDSYHRPVMLLWSMSGITSGLMTVAGFFIVIATWQPILAALFVVGTLPLLKWGQSTAHSVWMSHDLSTPDGRWASYFEDLLCEREAAKEVRLFNLPPLVLPRLNSYNTRHRVIQMGGVRLKTISLIPGRAAGVLAQYGAVALAAFQVLQLTISLGQFTLVIAALANCRQVLQNIIAEYVEIQENRHYFDDLFRFWDLRREIAAPADPVPVGPLEQDIRIEHVSFCYPRSERWVLRDVSLDVPQGGSLAIVGLNGAGKTTLIKLLARLYDPTEGRVLWNGTDIRRFDPDSYREHLSVVFQDFFEYQLSLKENITIGSGFEHDPEWLERVLGFLGIAKLARTLRDGADTLLGRQFHVHGEDLSGGQWQRVALARALYRTRSASLLVLDEPTSAMDAEQEATLYDSIGEWKGERTLILISHRLSSVRRCDRIVVLDEGRIVEAGDHESLMISGGLYSRLFETQAKGYAQPTTTVHDEPASQLGNLRAEGTRSWKL